jgi:hypothetical protein
MTDFAEVIATMAGGRAASTLVRTSWDVSEVIFEALRAMKDTLDTYLSPFSRNHPLSRAGIEKNHDGNFCPAKCREPR